ncbi:MAG: hypothetical protein ACK5NU_02350 [Fusobacterium ulcerans]|uniref:hypothetical protein n=1 Tax=Fusobacterium ulcerans TaxID=861 RepID=UPI003A859588
MSGFKNSSLNHDFKKGIYEIIIEGLIECCKLMKDSFTSQSKKIVNHEEKIRTHLVENYLENDIKRNKTSLVQQQLRFLAEAQENYDSKNESYKGRVDIKVVSSDFLSNGNAYYIIECKRIDGNISLNTKYITEGVKRFTTLKYSSYYNKNIMFGFIVRDLNIQKNIQDIDKLHKELIGNIIQKDITPIKCGECNEYSVCESKYNVNEKQLMLNHIFYNFSNIIE